MPQYANTGAFQIDTIRDYDMHLNQNQYITVLYKMHPFLKEGLIFYAGILRRTNQNMVLQILLYGLHRSKETEKETRIQAAEGGQRMGT